ncbi:MAG: aldo/keto reductase, partial [Actinomycetota bacterium]
MTMNLTLNNGVTMPALGFGVFQASPDETVDAVSSALETGYRLIDTAAAYGNEREVGEAIRRSGIARDELFVTTKVWHEDLAAPRFAESAARAVDALGIGPVDLLLI